MALKPTVLLYNFTDRRRKMKINTFCAMHGIRVKSVESSDYEKPILALVDREAESLFVGGDTSGEEQKSAENSEDIFREEMLVMCSLGGQMNPLLAYLRKEKVLVPLKAIMTPTNQAWTSVELYTEIKKEHEQMAQMTPEA
jgi:hypothetical protein